MSKPVLIHRSDAAQRLESLANALRSGQVRTDGPLVQVPDRVRLDVEVGSQGIGLKVDWAELRTGAAPIADSNPLGEELLEEADNRAAARMAETVEEEDEAVRLDAREGRLP